MSQGTDITIFTKGDGSQMVTVLLQRLAVSVKTHLLQTAVTVHGGTVIDIHNSFLQPLNIIHMLLVELGDIHHSLLGTVTVTEMTMAFAVIFAKTAMVSLCNIIAVFTRDERIVSNHKLQLPRLTSILVLGNREGQNFCTFTTIILDDADIHRLLDLTVKLLELLLHLSKLSDLFPLLACNLFKSRNLLFEAGNTALILSDKTGESGNSLERIGCSGSTGGKVNMTVVGTVAISSLDREDITHIGTGAVTLFQGLRTHNNREAIDGTHLDLLSNETTGIILHVTAFVFIGEKTRTDMQSVDIVTLGIPVGSILETYHIGMEIIKDSLSILQVFLGIVKTDGNISLLGIESLTL